MPFRDLERISGIEVRRQVPMASLTSFRIGGPARCLVIPRTLQALEKTLGTLKALDVPYKVLGKGTNLLVDDRGTGVVLCLSGLSQIDMRPAHGNQVRIKAEAGVGLGRLLSFCARYGLEGLEALCGIPGSVGGAVRMNAGTRDLSIKDLIERVRLTSPDGSTWVGADALSFGYRKARLPEGTLVSGVVLRLRRGPAKLLFARIKGIMRTRRVTQPIGLPSAGCIFKNPPGEFAGRLIESCGLKGKILGRAQVSRIHANFIVNLGGARASEVTALMSHMSDEVEKKTGIRLVPEIEIWKENNDKETHRFH